MPTDRHNTVSTRQRQWCATQARMLRVLTILDSLLTIRATRANKTFIHDFRVASRRAHEVLHVGILALTSSQRNNARHVVKGLRQLRRAAGRVRDLDVLTDNLTKLSTTQEPAHLAGHDAARRQVLQRLCLDINRFAADARLKQLAAQIRQTPEEHLIAKLNTRIERNHRRFSELAASALAKPTDRHTHRLRIAGKRLRYALELLPRHNRQLTSTLQVLKDLQDALGQRHDLEVLRQHLQHIKRTLPLAGVGLSQKQWKQLMHQTDDRIESLMQSFTANPSLRELMTSSAMHF